MKKALLLLFLIGCSGTQTPRSKNLREHELCVQNCMFQSSSETVIQVEQGVGDLMGVCDLECSK